MLKNTKYLFFIKTCKYLIIQISMFVIIKRKILCFYIEIKLKSTCS